MPPGIIITSERGRFRISRISSKRLAYIFHNPNGAEETAEHILKIFVAANMAKIEAAIKASSESSVSVCNKAEEYENN